MRKIRNVFIVTMVLLVLTSGAAYAASYTGTDNVRGVVYNKELSGTRVRTYSVGTSTAAYTTATNITTGTLTVSADIWEYTYNTGITQKNGNTDTSLAAGLQVASGSVSRSAYSTIKYYKHMVSVYSNPGLTGVMESFQYIGNQYY